MQDAGEIKMSVIILANLSTVCDFTVILTKTQEETCEITELLFSGEISEYLFLSNIYFSFLWR